MAHPLHAFFVRIPLFSGLSLQELEDVVRIVRPVTLGAGEVLFSEGSPGDAAFVVQTGRIEVYRSVGGQEVTIHRFGPSEVLGELALLDGEPRSASARALEAATLLGIDKAEFDQLRQALRPAAYVIIRSLAVTLAGRIRETNAQVASLLAEARPDVENPPSKGGLLKRLLGGGR